MAHAASTQVNREQVERGADPCSADGDNSRLSGLASELVSLGVRVIATTDRVPIVVMGGSALVERGEALSVSRPVRT